MPNELSIPTLFSQYKILFEQYTDTKYGTKWAENK